MKVQTSPINKNYGVVRRISKDRSTIWIRLPRGGLVEAPNAGFEVGDTVCFLTGLDRRIKQVIPKFVADLMVEVGNNPYLQAVIQQEDTTDGEYDPDDDWPDNRPSVEERPDLYGYEYREIDEIGPSDPDNTDGTHPAIWPGHQGFNGL